MSKLTAILLFLVPMTALAVENQYFDSDGVRLRYIVGGEGETVVLLHGFSGSAEGLYVEPGTFGALVEAGFRVVALDQRGHGNSDKPHGPDDYGLEMVEDVRRLLDHLHVDKVHLAGYSMGSKVANTFRERYPERLYSIVLGGYGWPWRSSRVTLAEARERLSTRMVLPGNDLDALAAVSAASYDLTPSVADLESNRIPALAIIGADDTTVPREDFQTLADTMANLETAVIPGTHAGPDGAPYKPEYARKLVGFLTSR
jgi:pimeloyl-ACP methyl ester carboxylesterase